MKLTLECPKAEYNGTMRILCKACGCLCGHQRYRICKGWAELTEGSKSCPMRNKEEKEHP